MPLHVSLCDHIHRNVYRLREEQCSVQKILRRRNAPEQCLAIFSAQTHPNSQIATMGPMGIATILHLLTWPCATCPGNGHSGANDQMIVESPDQLYERHKGNVPSATTVTVYWGWLSNQQFLFNVSYILEK